jgi:hypothetical protein
LRAITENCDLCETFSTLIFVFVFTLNKILCHYCSFQRFWKFCLSNFPLMIFVMHRKKLRTAIKRFLLFLFLVEQRKYFFQGRSDGVSRVSNAYGPTAQGGPPKEKIYTRYFLKNCQKQGNHKFRTFCLRAHEATLPF